MWLLVQPEGCMPVQRRWCTKLFLCGQQVVDASDVVLEVLDARDPLGCRCPQVVNIVDDFLVYSLLILHTMLYCIASWNSLNIEVKKRYLQWWKVRPGKIWKISVGSNAYMSYMCLHFAGGPCFANWVTCRWRN